jgi:hypothetical protein
MSWVGDLLWRLLPWKLREAECTHFELAVHTGAENVEGCEKSASRSAVSGCICDGAWSAGSSAAATTRRTSTPHAIFRRPATRSVEPWGWCYPDKVVMPDVAMLQQ